MKVGCPFCYQLSVEFYFWRVRLPHHAASGVDAWIPSFAGMTGGAGLAFVHHGVYDIWGKRGDFHAQFSAQGFHDGVAKGLQLPLV